MSVLVRFFILTLALGLLPGMAAAQNPAKDAFLGRWEGCGEPQLVVQWKDGRLVASTFFKGRALATTQVVVANNNITIDFVVEKQIGRNYHVGDKGHIGLRAWPAPDERIVRHLEFVGTLKGSNLFVECQYYDEMESHGLVDIFPYGKFLLCKDMKRTPL